MFYSQTRCIIEQQWVCDLHKTLRRFLKSAAFSKTLLEYAGHGDITARRYFLMNVNGGSVVIHERIWWALLLLSMFPVYSSQVSWCRSQLDREIDKHQEDKQTHTLLIRRRFGRVLEWSSYDRWYWVAKKGVPSFPVEAPLGSGVVTNARHRKPSLSVWEEEADIRDQTAPHLSALSLQKSF